MSISSEELIYLLRGTLPQAAPLERANLETYIALIGRKGITAQLNSEHSRFLQRTIRNFYQYWDAEVVNQMERAELYGAAVPLINAFARVVGRGRQIILLEGIQQTTLFYAHFIAVLNLLMQLRANKFIDIDGWRGKEALSFSFAGHSLLYQYMKTGEPLIALVDMLGQQASQNTTHGYQATIAFLLVHELGHHVLGHTRSSQALAERNQVSLGIEESIDVYQQQGFEADRYALTAFPAGLRAGLMSSVIFFFGPMAFMEAFAHPSKPTHPLFANRAWHLASLLSLEDPSTRIVIGIIRSQIEGFKTVAEMFGPGDTDLRPRIHDTMPVELAYQVIQAVKNAVAKEQGKLDLPTEAFAPN